MLMIKLVNREFLVQYTAEPQFKQLLKVSKTDNLTQFEWKNEN